MFKNIMIFLTIFIFVTVTTVILIFKPKTHKPIMFENRNFKLEMMTESAEVNLDSVKIDITPIKTATSEAKNDTAKANNNEEKKRLEQQLRESEEKIKRLKAQVEEKERLRLKATQSQQQQNTQKQPKPNNIASKQESYAPPVPVTLPEPKVESAKPVTKKVLSAEEEEIIAWNVWRSELQNKLMKDSKMSAPVGTSFMFSFTVDKFGNISNIKTWSANSSYTPMAVRILKPLLLSYANQPILKFPAKSKRVITNVNGGFRMAYSSRYSKPSDYNDYERVK